MDPTNARGQYGRQDMRIGRGESRTLVSPDQPSAWPQIDYETTGAALGIGVLLGVIIGSKMTFHSPVRRRR
jgi:hypothetical protein